MGQGGQGRKHSNKNVKLFGRNKSKFNSNYITLIDPKEILRLDFKMVIVRQENQMTVCLWKRRHFMVVVE